MVVRMTEPQAQAYFEEVAQHAIQPFRPVVIFLKTDLDFRIIASIRAAGFNIVLPQEFEDELYLRGPHAAAGVLFDVVRKAWREYPGEPVGDHIHLGEE